MFDFHEKTVNVLMLSPPVRPIQARKSPENASQMSPISAKVVSVYKETRQYRVVVQIATMTFYGAADQMVWRGFDFLRYHF